MTNSTTATLLNSLVFVLGAADPEMQAIELAIEHICQQLGVRANVQYAAFVGADGTVNRCHGGVAYKATHLLDSWELICNGLDSAISTTIPAGRTPIWIECEHVGSVRSGHVIDHHRAGDPGYGLPPSQFWEASSIGQIYALFLENGVDLQLCAAAFGEDRFLIAASDHCPGHAFAGKCPGVDIPALKAMRAANSAAFNKMDPETWIQVVDASIAKLQASPRGELAGHVYAIASEDIALGNHAQLISGLPMEYTMPGSPRDPRVKVGLLGGEPELVAAWMASKASQLTDIYGDPARGYAGGYLPS